MKRAVIALLLGVLAVVALVLLLNFRGQDKIHDAPPLTPPAGESVARGAYLLSDEDVAAVITHIRGAWDNKVSLRSAQSPHVTAFRPSAP